MTQKFEIGDVVRLRSGGPSMTVANLGNYPYHGFRYECIWFDERDTKNGEKRDLFREEDVEMVHPSPHRSGIPSPWKEASGGLNL